MAKKSDKKVLVESLLDKETKDSIATLKENINRYNEVNKVMESLKEELKTLKESICGSIKDLDVDEVDLDNNVTASVVKQTNVKYKDTDGIIKLLKDNNLDSKYLETAIKETDLNKELKVTDSTVSKLLKDLFETSTTIKLTVKGE